MRKIMMPNVSKRYTLSQIKSHQWFKKNFNKHDDSSRASTPTSPIVHHKKHCASSAESAHRLSSASQPINCAANLQITTTTLTDSLNRASFSQPAQPENMFLSTQMPSTPIGNSQNIYQRLVRRMTRFFTNTDAKTTLHKLKCLFDKHNYAYKKCAAGQVSHQNDWSLVNLF
jgi:serine/threonine-protein kinase Chk1